MNKNLLILGGVALVGTALFFYFKSKQAATPAGPTVKPAQNVVNKPTATGLVGAVFGNGGNTAPNTSGVSAGQPLFNVTNMLSGIFHPTETNTATPGAQETTATFQS